MLCINIYVALGLPCQILAKMRSPGPPVLSALPRNMQASAADATCKPVTRREGRPLSSGCVLSLDLPLGLPDSLPLLSACPRAQELSSARCRREKPPRFEAVPWLR